MFSHVFGTLEDTTKAQGVASKGLNCAALLKVPVQTRSIWTSAAAWVQAEHAQPC